MIEKMGPIKNPLTIIAIFAAIAEISGTIVLPFIASANQFIYVWFLIIFPSLLIVLFFLTLNFNHKVLYAPSDYQNEDNFLRSLPRASLAEKVMKIEAEIAEEETATRNLPTSEEAAPASTNAPIAVERSLSQHNIIRRSAHASYVLADELIFQKLSKEFSSEIQREVKIDSLSRRYIFDGIVREKGTTTVIEVRFLRGPMMSSIALRDTLSRIQISAKLLPKEQTANFRVLLAMASYEGNINQESVVAQIDRYRSEFAYPIEVRFYNLTELEREFNVGLL